MGLLILDRDGVINEDSDAYIRTLEDWQPIAGSIAAIARLSQAGYQVVIATNQSGLGRGYFGLEVLQGIHARLCQLVEAEGGTVSGIFYCPHTPDDRCDCRKPATGLLRAIELEFGESAQGAWFIGDSLKDLQAARAHGCKPLLVTTGKGADTVVALRSGNPGLADPDKVPIFADLATAATAIIDGAL